MRGLRRLLHLGGLGGGLLVARGTAFADAADKKFTAEEVAERDGLDGRPLWITFRGVVHDVTEFQKEHPGGKLIEQAGGGDVESFWKHWHYHFHSPKVVDALRRTRIGSLVNPNDEEADAAAADEDLYCADPARDLSKHLRWLSKPFNSETRRSVLSESYITPTDALYIRNHAPVPAITDPDAHRVAFVDGEDQVGSASVTELLSKFKSATVTSILQCAGNRAIDDAKAYGPNGFKGTPFEQLGCGMVGNVQWTGVRLSDLLPSMFPKLRSLAKVAATGCDDAIQEDLHIIFEGADGYESSTPARAVLSDGGDCLLATHMNGEPLPADHGFPCRALLPGIAGGRSVKWLTCIRLSDRPSSAPWNANYYKRADGSEVQALPLQSIILQPTQHESVVPEADGTVAVQGVAYNGAGGAAIRTVEVTSDDGATWHQATLLYDEVLKDDTSGRPHHWLRWSARVPLGLAGSRLKEGACVVSCRATDADGHAQPKVSQQHRGYLYNGWFMVTLDVHDWLMPPTDKKSQ